ncbi:hypothetical protein [Halorussus halobius]|uniref:hypothetical protein n=1 Tax=Halorussus halobius TaxID=1710537 RepID=UPI00109271FB|nr:hypothetical protein [Halorussus halobius]
MIRALRSRIGLIELALAVFSAVGVLLTAVAGYAAVSTLSLPVSGSPGLAVAVLSGASLVAFVAAASKLLRPQNPSQVR